MLVGHGTTRIVHHIGLKTRQGQQMESRTIILKFACGVVVVYEDETFKRGLSLEVLEVRATRRLKTYS